MTQHQNKPSRANLAIEYLATTSLTPDPKNARKHSARQIGKLARIIEDYGWSSPIVIDEERVVIAGHARLAAAKSIGMIEVPCVRLAHLSAAQKKALAIADNAMTDASSFDDSVLREVLLELTDLNFDMELTGLEMGVIDFVIDGGSGESQSDPADIVAAPDHASRAVSKCGDQWQLGEHRLLCGNAIDPLAYEHLLGDDRAAMVFSDPPYNVPIDGHVSGLGRHRHREFAMASSEMTGDEFRSFLASFMRLLCAFSKNGAIHYVCIDWGHVRTMLEAGDGIYAEVKNICVWNKSNAGMGSLYRSKHELLGGFRPIHAIPWRARERPLRPASVIHILSSDRTQCT